MKIIDIDGCLADFVRCGFLAVTNKLFGTSFTMEDVTDWDFRVCLGLSAEQVARVWTSDELVESYRHADMFQMGYEYVKQAMESGEEALYLTASGIAIPGIAGMDDYSYLQRVRRSRNFWMANNPLPAAGTLYSLDKLGPIRLLDELFGISEILDDSPTTALKLADAGFKVRMPVWPYNEYVERMNHDNIIPVKNWR